MAPTTFDQWFAIQNVKKEIPEEYKTLFEDCWNSARINIEDDVKELEKRIIDLEDSSCPYEYCIDGDYENIQNDLSYANESLNKCEKIKNKFKTSFGCFGEVVDALDDAIENADYQLIVDSVSKDLRNVFSDFEDIKEDFKDIDF